MGKWGVNLVKWTFRGLRTALGLSSMFFVYLCVSALFWKGLGLSSDSWRAPKKWRCWWFGTVVYRDFVLTLHQIHSGSVRGSQKAV